MDKKKIGTKKQQNRKERWT